MNAALACVVPPSVTSCIEPISSETDRVAIRDPLVGDAAGNTNVSPWVKPPQE